MDSAEIAEASEVTQLGVAQDVEATHRLGGVRRGVQGSVHSLGWRRMLRPPTDWVGEGGVQGEGMEVQRCMRPLRWHS